MKIPKYIEETLRKRSKASVKLTEFDLIEVTGNGE